MGAVIAIAVIIGLIIIFSRRVKVGSNPETGALRLQRRSKTRRYRKTAERRGVPRTNGSGRPVYKAPGTLSPERIRVLRDRAARAHAERACGHTPKPQDARAIAILRTYGIDD